MVANARFSLEAIDNTQAAFQSVQQNLRRMQATAETAGKSLTKNLDVKDAMRSVGLALGLSADKIAEKLARLVTGTSAEQEQLSNQAMAAQEQLNDLQEKNTQARLGDEHALLKLQLQRAQLEKEITKPKGELGTASYNENLVNQIALEKTIIEITQLGNKIADDRNKVIKEAAEIRANYNALIKELGPLQNQVYGSRVSLQDKVIGLQAKEGKIMTDLAQTAQNDLVTRTVLLEDLKKTYQDLIPVMNEYKKTGMEAGQIIASGFEDAVFAANDFRSILRSMASDILRLFFREQITAPLASGLGDFFNKILGRAGGGPVMGSTPYIVGEKGPELFVPRSSGTIVSNQNLMGGGGGGNVNITYNIASGVTRAELGPLLEINRRQLKAEIPDMVRRGGAYRAAFA